LTSDDALQLGLGAYVLFVLFHEYIFFINI